MVLKIKWICLSKEWLNRTVSLQTLQKWLHKADDLPRQGKSVKIAQKTFPHSMAAQDSEQSWQVLLYNATALKLPSVTVNLKDE